MNRWLAEESKWAREQAIKTQTQIANLSDVTWRQNRVRQLLRDQAELFTVIQRHHDRVSEMHLLEDPQALRDHISLLRRQIESWEHLADDASARLAQAEDEQDALTL